MFLKTHCIKGFVGIGCAPCTRAISEGEDIRAGRWWWNQVIKNAACTKGKENNKHKENNNSRVLVVQQPYTLNFKL
jgi:3'-phosphoadenosine 5'-phosphosulfate sulfotransferase (PAPS reductase)/FAD synthetase